MTTNLRQRFADFYKSDKIKQQILPDDRENILAFIKAELLSLAEEVDNLPITSGSVANAAAIIRTRAEEISG